jgi:hypothetical protein
MIVDMAHGANDMDIQYLYRNHGFFKTHISSDIWIVHVVEPHVIWGNDCSKLKLVHPATGKVIRFEGRENMMRWGEKHNYKLYWSPIKINGKLTYNLAS